MEQGAGMETYDQRKRRVARKVFNKRDVSGPSEGQMQLDAFAERIHRSGVDFKGDQPPKRRRIVGKQPGGTLINDPVSRQMKKGQ